MEWCRILFPRKKAEDQFVNDLTNGILDDAKSCHNLQFPRKKLELDVQIKYDKN